MVLSVSCRKSAWKRHCQKTCTRFKWDKRGRGECGIKGSKIFNIRRTDEARAGERTKEARVGIRKGGCGEK